MWQPPTDNLYKFMAIAGLVLFALGLYVPLLKVDDYKLQAAQWTASVKPLIARLDQSVSAAGEEFQCAIDTAPGKTVNPGRLKQCAEIQAASPKRLEASKELVVTKAQLDGQLDVLEYLRRQTVIYQIGGLLVAALGAAVSLNGFRLWYTRVQKFLDAEAIEKTKGTGEQAQASL